MHIGRLVGGTQGIWKRNVELHDRFDGTRDFSRIVEAIGKYLGGVIELDTVDISQCKSYISNLGRSRRFPE
jgi:hypothetical protein